MPAGPAPGPDPSRLYPPGQQVHLPLHRSILLASVLILGGLEIFLNNASKIFEVAEIITQWNLLLPSGVWISRKAYD
jgi:hypothetical protein